MPTRLFVDSPESETGETCVGDFVCKDCGGSYIEEVQASVVVSSIVTEIRDGELHYGECTNHDGFIERYQCTKCGKHLKDSAGQLITTPDDLFVMLNELSEPLDD
jgi:DNA-directed RNA polymerase subunit RPC12/RpoP